MPKIARIDEIEVNGEFVQIHVNDENEEPILIIEEIVTSGAMSTIDNPSKETIGEMQLLQSELLNIMNIPTTEYSQEPYSKTNMNLYKDMILTDFNNRSLSQLGIIDDRIDELGGYNSAKIEFNDNAVEGLLQVTIEWLEIINGNFNDLLGLVGVNNFLVSMMVETVLEEILINTSDMVDNTDVSIFQIVGETLGVLGVGLAAASTLSITATGAAIVAAIYGIARLANKFLSSSSDDLSNTSLGLPQSTYPTATDIQIFNPQMANIQPNDFQIMLTQQLDPLAETYYKTESQEIVQMLAFNDTGYQPNQTQDITSLLGVDGDENAFSKLFGTVMLSNVNEMQEQGTMDLVKAMEETEEFFKTFTDVIANTPTSDLAEIYTTIHNQNLDSSDKYDTVYKTDRLYDNSNAHAKQMLYTDTYESKTNTNTVTMQDLKSYMNNLTNLIPPTVEHTYDIPIINYITVNEAEKNDYDEFARKIKREIVNEILSLKTQTF